MTQIEKDVPAPVRYPSQKSEAEAIFAQMEPGDSVLIEPTPDIPRRPTNWKSYASEWARYQTSRGNPMKFVTRIEGTGIRIWRKA